MQRVLTSGDAWAPQRAAVRRALRDKGISQAQLARDLGLSPKHVNQMLTGAMDGRLPLWVGMAHRLEMTWQLTPIEPVDHTVAWMRDQLGVDIEPWQAIQLREYMRSER